MLLNSYCGVNYVYVTNTSTSVNSLSMFIIN